MLNAAVKSQGINWIKRALPWITGVIAIMGTTTFVEFLYEESLQTAGMGVYIAISNKQWATAREALNKAKGILATANFIYTYLGWIAPYSFNVFRNYAKATQSQYDVYDKVISAQIGTVSDPTAPGKVFNITEANKNIANGTSPAVDTMIAGVLEEPTTIIKIRSVTDGDTVKAILPNESIESTIRLLGIDSPEKGATGYKQSMAWLNSKLLGADVTLLIDPKNAKDNYGRVLAVIMKDGVNINLEEVKAGYAIYFPYEGNIHVDENEFMMAETSAKAANLGNWALTGAGEAPVNVTIPETPTAPAVKTKITEQAFFEEMKKFYAGKMYMSKKELAELISKYDVSEIQTFIDEVYTYYTGRAYLSKLELVDLGAKHGFNISGLV
jgi:micrococcal nuclease